MGSTDLPPKALSLKSNVVKFDRCSNEVHRDFRAKGISEINLPVKMSEKSAIC